MDINFDGGLLPMNAAVMQDSVLTSVLVLSDVSLENTRTYTCTANNTDRGVVNDNTSYLTVASKYIYVPVCKPMYMYMSVLQNTCNRTFCEGELLKVVWRHAFPHKKFVDSLRLLLGPV